jgi:hypothetical protein
MMALTETARNMKYTDLTGSPKRDAAPFNIRKRIGSTDYEVDVYFSAESGETMDDKILRLVRGEAVQGKEGKK